MTYRTTRWWIVGSALAAGITLALGCGESVSRVTQRPGSIRGWIADVERTLPEGVDSSMVLNDPGSLYVQETNVYIEGVDFISGTVENGAFVMFDVPNGDVTLSFQAPGVEGSKLLIKGLPPSADLTIPAVIVEKGGSRLADASKAAVRIPIRSGSPREVPSTTFVNGARIRTLEVPYKSMGDRMNVIPRGTYPEY